MRWVLSRHVPPVKKLLLVESGPRPIAEKFITQFRELYGEELPIDLLTCLPSDPPGLTANGVRGEVFRVIDCHDHRTRWRLLRQIRAKRHPATAIICADSPILGLWKMAALALFPSKFLIINENADFFWLDRGHRGAAQQFLLHRIGWREGFGLQNGGRDPHCSLRVRVLAGLCARRPRSAARPDGDRPSPAPRPEFLDTACNPRSFRMVLGAGSISEGR